MDIYSKKSRWKLYLGGAGLVIVLISMFFTNYLTSKLADEEQKKVKNYLFALEKVNDDKNFNPDCDYTLHQMIISSNTTIPVILVDDKDKVELGVNFGENLDANTEYLEKEVDQLIEEGVEPVTGFAQKVYYKESTLITLLRYFPLFQLFLIAAFIIFGYLSFSSARRAEQNQVWVGMAKETAHQLGTPISAIIGWIEHLKFMYEQDDDMGEVVTELRKDVARLELIAERFSKIGAEPVLHPVDVYEELEECRAYMQRRAPRKVAFEFPTPDINRESILININPPLFDWVIENLLRNALDAMEGKGKISAEVYDDEHFVYIDISDTGKGIPTSKFKTVFQPGFTTKKRGWGLGLSLAKRIIAEYHSGKIFVKKSEENVGTTFTIKLPKR